MGADDDTDWWYSEEWTDDAWFGSYPDDGPAWFSGKKGKGRGGGKGPSAQEPCFKCGSSQHWSKDCPKGSGKGVTVRDIWHRASDQSWEKTLAKSGIGRCQGAATALALLLIAVAASVGLWSVLAEGRGPYQSQLVTFPWLEREMKSLDGDSPRWVDFRAFHRRVRLPKATVPPLPRPESLDER